MTSLSENERDNAAEKQGQELHSGKTASHLLLQMRKEVTVLKEMTKGERLMAEIFSTITNKSEPVLTDMHPFLRKVIPFFESRKYWSGSATELLAAIGDNSTPPNTVTKLLNQYDYEFFYKKEIVIRFHRTSRKRLIEFTNYRYGKCRLM